MNESLQVVLLTGALGTGIVAILMSNQLAKKYKLPWLSSYFYYLIFLFIFGIYGIIGSRLIRLYLEAQAMPPETIDNICHFVSFLGIPFLVLSWYMFIRLAHELVNRRISPMFNLLFFSVVSLVFVSIGLMLVSKQIFGVSRFEIMRNMMLGSFTVLTVLIYAYSLVQLFIHSGRFLDRKDRDNIRLFGLFYILFTLMTSILVNFSHKGMLIGLLFILMLFAFHLPPLFFLSMYLDKNFVEPVARQDFDQSLSVFIRKFEISKRESEIVELICKGKSNQDISESLFISLQTVKDHIHRIYLKTGVKNRVQLTNLIRSRSTENA
jgi:DNA-binding CsgD family transcriptional regulator